MCSLEKLKELAVSQMRAAADLYEVCEKAEKEMKEDNDTYNKTYLRAQRNYRYQLLNHLLGLTPTTEEKDLWDEIMEELD
jgi:gamma-glutamylcysteine synthetase